MATLSSPTLQRLLVNVRVLLNARDPNNSFWSDAELTEYLNDALSIYFLEAATADEGLFTTTTDLNLVTDTETVALPTDCFQVKNVWKKVTNGYILLPYKNNLTGSYSTQGGTSSEGYLPEYSFRGNNLVFHPIPNFSETAGIKLEYIQFPDQMVWGGDSLTAQASPVFKQLLETYAVYKAKWRESLTNGGEAYKTAQTLLEGLYTTYKNNIARRSKNPVYIEAFNPETE